MRALSALALVLAACGGPNYVRGTKIEDTADNRAIMQTVDDYRKAMEKRDVAALLALAHKRYWEDGGSATAEDDYGYDGLKDVLQKRLGQTKQVRFGLIFRRITHQDARALVDVYIDASFHVQTDGRDKWQRVTSDNRLELAREGNSWLFLSGM